LGIGLRRHDRGFWNYPMNRLKRWWGVTGIFGLNGRRMRESSIIAGGLSPLLFLQ
jgi:hypothetical protein